MSVEEDERLVLVRKMGKMQMVEKNGLLVVSGPLSQGRLRDHRDLREEHIER